MNIGDLTDKTLRMSLINKLRELKRLVEHYPTIYLRLTYPGVRYEDDIETINSWIEAFQTMIPSNEEKRKDVHLIMQLANEIHQVHIEGKYNDFKR